MLKDKKNNKPAFAKTKTIKTCFFFRKSSTHLFDFCIYLFFVVVFFFAQNNRQTDIQDVADLYIYKVDCIIFLFKKIKLLMLWLLLLEMFS